MELSHLKNFKNWLFESVNRDFEFWYGLLSDSHGDYIESEEFYNNPEDDWDEDEYGPKFWVFEKPVHEYIKEKDMLLILPEIAEFGESIGLDFSILDIEHYMMNDFSISWKGYSYPTFNIRVEGDEHETQSIIIGPNKDRTLHNIVGAHLVVEMFLGETKSKMWSLTKKEDIPDLIMDLYDIKKEIEIKK